MTSCCGDGKARPWSGGLGSLPFVSPQLLAPTRQRRRATARQRGAAAAARISCSNSFLAGPWPGLTQAIGGLALGLIALFSSYNHLTFAGRDIPIPQQWGIPLIAASVAIVFVVAEGISAAVAQLATGSRLRAAHERN